MNKDDLRIYSVNLMAYILTVRPSVTWEAAYDEESHKTYFVIHENVGREINQYKDDRGMQEFISNCTFVRKVIRNNNNLHQA